MAQDSVIVVGAGHIGIACAHYLARDGHEVTVIDQDLDRQQDRTRPAAVFLHRVAF